MTAFRLIDSETALSRFALPHRDRILTDNPIGCIACSFLPMPWPPQAGVAGCAANR
jgi:hypothetical protein